MTTLHSLQAATFSLDAYNSGEVEIFFHGFTDGQRWNGFACPSFTLEDAQRLAAINNVTPYCGHIKYDPDRDAFIFDEHGDGGDTALALPSVEFGAVTVEGQKLYSIGAFAWCWYEADPDDRVARFSRELVREMREMRKVGIVVPDAAIELAHIKSEVDDVLHMAVSDAASLMIELAQVRQ